MSTLSVSRGPTPFYIVNATISSIWLTNSLSTTFYWRDRRNLCLDYDAQAESLTD
jgi:hypothetical protein